MRGSTVSMSRFGWYVRVRLRQSITKDWVLLRMHTTMHKQLQTYSYSTDPSNSQQEKERGREPSKLEKICTSNSIRMLRS